MSKLMIIVLLLASTAQAQDNFFNKKKVFVFTALALSMAADGYTTQRTLNSEGGYEQNPIARPFVKLGWGGQAGVSGASYAAVITSCYWLHKHKHRKLEYVLPIVLMAASAVMSQHNRTAY